MSADKPTYKDALPFQQQNVATNQQVAIPYLAGERVMSVIWISAPIDEQIQNVSGSKKG